MSNLRIGTEVETIEGMKGRIIKVKGSFYQVELYDPRAPNDDLTVILPQDEVEVIGEAI